MRLNLLHTPEVADAERRARKAKAARDRRARNPEAGRNAVRRYAGKYPDRVLLSAGLWRARNPEAAAMARKVWRASNPDAVKSHRLKAAYGITFEQYEAMRTAQNGACASCKTVSTKRLHVDHDHATGAVRALLCGLCNVALGVLKEDPARILALMEYITRHKTGEGKCS